MDAQALKMTRSPVGHSSDVRMWLHYTTGSVRVLQSSDKSIKVAEPDQVTCGEATLEILVDGRSHRRAISVIGTSADSQWISIIDR
jgi:hypothetical protein